MSRTGLETAVLIISIAGIAAPAGKWLADGARPAIPEHRTVAESEAFGRPKMSSEELKTILQSRSDTSLTNKPRAFIGRTRVLMAKDTSVERDPFDIPPHPSTVSAGPALPPPPLLRLIGLVSDASGGSATIEIDGNVVSLRAGDSAYGIQLKSIEPPDVAFVKFGNRDLRVKME